MAKIALIGAGSLVFAKRLINDILHHSALQDAEFALMDINPKRLDYTRQMAQRMITEREVSAKITTTTDRREALKDADFVIIMLLVHGVEPIKIEFEIPTKYGVDQCVGDTLGPGGVFRFLRTASVVLDICRDVRDLAKPNCWILNYTNPMAMLTWAANLTHPDVNFVGLCHSVQGTTEMLANTIDVPYDQVRYYVAGINHQAWILQFSHADGTDLYPRLRDTLAKSSLYNTDKEDGETVRIEMMQHLGYFVTESSGHNSEYNPWFRKRDDLMKRYTGPGTAGETAYGVRIYDADRQDYERKLQEEIAKPGRLDLSSTHEYAASIINAIWTDQACSINGNVLNEGLITNLPHRCCVEVPCMVDAHGVNPCFVGALPPQCAALNRMNVNVQELAVQAYREKSRQHLYHALYFDPLTAAKLSLAEIRQMTDEILNAETVHNWLPELK